jgi:hypothetical protein
MRRILFERPGGVKRASPRVHGRGAARASRGAARAKPRDSRAARGLLERRGMHHRSLLRAARFLALLLVAPPPGAAGWRFEPLATDEAGASAVGASASGAIAMGDARGVWLRAAGAAAYRRLDLRGAVRDLAFAPDGALWIATSEGLLRYDGERVALRAPAPGESNRDVRRVAARAGAVAAITAAGAYWSRDGERFARVEVPAGEEPPTGLALEARAGADTVLWIAGARGLFAAPLAPRNGAAGVVAERAALPIDLRPALDVWAGDGRVLALSPTVLVERGPDGGFAVHRPQLPPGATPMRVDAGGGAIWIATDRGVVGAAAPAARFERAPAPAGTLASFDVAVAGDEVLAATARGLVIGPGLETAAAAAPAAASAPACEPPIDAVQRVALDYLRLEGDPAASMRRGVRLRGLMPIVQLSGSRGRDRDWRTNHDESYVSGGYRRLFDTDELRAQERQIELQLAWDLGDVAYNPEQVDVSTEARRLIELRDDVLDEINQLYFDRRRALAAAAEAAPDSPDAARERLRAAELAAGLDAWTAGWFGRQDACAP